MDLDDWRSRINDLDEQILNLLNQRVHAAREIGELKRQQDLPYFVPEREAQVLERLAALNVGPLPPEALKAVWREITSASLALENPLPVVYLGPPGTFTHQAATQRFGSSARLTPIKTTAEVFDEVERGRAERIGNMNALRPRSPAACPPSPCRQPPAPHAGATLEP